MENYKAKIILKMENYTKTIIKQTNDFTVFQIDGEIAHGFERTIMFDNIFIVIDKTIEGPNKKIMVVSPMRGNLKVYNKNGDIINSKIIEKYK